ncbi:MAG: Phosphoglycolate phosphatase [Methanosaeta sp. PtaU1.Bin060]|nr:MAG: Phosphoglycolate phosphatase [Methanosaeta sp. PtaU1.Bin060]
MIRALAVDIDGTLTDGNRVLCPSAVEAVRRLNVPMILATGNTHCFTRAVSVMLGTPRIFVAENGGVVSYSEDEMVILADLGICESAFREMSRVFPMQRYNSARYRFTDIALQHNFDLEKASRYAEAHGLPVDLIDTAFAVHIKDKRVNKGTGLEHVAERMQIDIKDFAAIGDSRSDISMFSLTGFRASVGNASPELRAVSDYVAKAKYGQGFAEIIDYMIKMKML